MPVDRTRRQLPGPVTRHYRVAVHIETRFDPIHQAEATAAGRR